MLRRKQHFDASRPRRPRRPDGTRPPGATVRGVSGRSHGQAGSDRRIPRARRRARAPRGVGSGRLGALYFDRRNADAKGGGTEFRRRRLGSTGKVRSFTIVHRAVPGVPTPYVSAIVDLDGGGVVKTNLLNVAPDPEVVQLGMIRDELEFLGGDPPRPHARLAGRDRDPQQRVGDRQVERGDVVGARRDRAAAHPAPARSRRPRGHAEVRLHRRARRARARERARDRGAGRGGRAREGAARRIGVSVLSATSCSSARRAASPDAASEPGRPRADRQRPRCAASTPTPRPR